MKMRSHLMFAGLALLLLGACSDDPAAPVQSPPTLEEIHAYADAHYDVARLAAAFGDNPNEYAGTAYYGVNHHEDLSLWVSREDDEREYYENAGKWDQFVFGWDDFVDPRTLLHTTEVNTANLRIDGVSAHRAEFRGMWEAWEEAR